MKSLFAAAASIFGLVLVMSPIADLHAAELKVLAGGSMTGPLNELGPQFERASGHKLVIHFDSTPNLIKLATSTPFDLGVVPVDVFKNAEAKARFAPGPTIGYRPRRLRGRGARGYAQARRRHARRVEKDAA